MPEKTDQIARERIENLRAEFERISRRLDNYAKGVQDKLAGDIQLATRVEQIQTLVDRLDAVLVRGEGNTPSVKASVDSLLRRKQELSEELEGLREEVTLLRNQREDLRASLQQGESSVQVARITSRTESWKTTATLIGTLLVALVSLAVSLFGG
jgi:chromosome segregation ATPase